MHAEYRETRVKVTEAIELALMKLVQYEDDIYKKKKHPAKWYRDEVAKRLKLEDKDNPSLRSYEVAISPLKIKLANPGPLDQPWHLGIDEYPIANEVKRILQIQRIAYNPITIRWARWIARLAPCINKDDNLLKDISFGYSYLELKADLFNEQFNSSEYDKLLLDNPKLLLNKLCLDVDDTDKAREIPNRIIQVIFSKGTAYGVIKNGSKFKWGNARGIKFILQRKGVLGESIITVDGEEITTIKGLLLADKKQLLQTVKEGDK